MNMNGKEARTDKKICQSVWMKLAWTIKGGEFTIANAERHVQIHRNVLILRNSSFPLHDRNRGPVNVSSTPSLITIIQ